MPPRYRALTTGRANRAAARSAVRFLAGLWDYEPEAFTFVSTRSDKSWRHHPIQGEDRATQISNILEAYSSEHFDIYFCPNAFSEPHPRTENALPSRYAHCDIDQADPAGYDPQPNILWETSPGRFQGIWIWSEEAEGTIAEQYSRNIVYKDGGDQGGWSITKMLRVPGTINHKADYDRPVVTLRSFDATRQKLPKSISDPGLNRRTLVTRDWSGASDEIDPFKHDPSEVTAKFQKNMFPFPRSLLTAERVVFPDKSNALYAVITELIGLAATNDEIASALRENPHFTHREGMTLDALCADILRIRAKWEAEQ